MAKIGDYIKVFFIGEKDFYVEVIDTDMEWFCSTISRKHYLVVNKDGDLKVVFEDSVGFFYTCPKSE